MEESRRADEVDVDKRVRSQKFVMITENDKRNKRSETSKGAERIHDQKVGSRE